jgi:predicted ABC-type ATPase
VKDIVLLGGPNGAGKTTASRVLLPQFLNELRFLNADEIARQIAPANPSSVAVTAGKILIQRIHTLVLNGESFVLETTCSGKSYARLLEKCQRAGWRIKLLYLWLPSPESAVERVARRVSRGGHNIPVEVIYRRYAAGVRNMRMLYLPLAEEAEIYDNSDNGRVLIARKRRGHTLQVHDVDRWAAIEASTP